MASSKSRQQGQAQPARKLVIKPLAKKPQLPTDFEAVTWRKLEDAVHAVHEKRAVSSSLEELYRAVEDMCLHKLAERVYVNLRQECQQHIGRMVAQLATQGAMDLVVFLGQVAALWSDHTQAMLTLRSIFLYLDRTYVVPCAGPRSLFDLGLLLLRNHLDQHPQVAAKIVDALLQQIEAERRGNAVDRGLLADVLRMLDALGLYAEAFEHQFQQRTELFYAAEGVSGLSSMEVPEYLLHSERRLQEEHERCRQYLGASTRRPLIACVEEQLLTLHVEALLDKGFAGLMSPDRMSDLARLYSLLMRVKALDALRAAFKDYVKVSGLAIIMDEEKDKEMVKLLLEFRTKLDTCVSRAFQANENFGNALKEAFEHFINQRANKPAELIAKFLDGELRAGSKASSQEELEQTLDQALLLFRYISGKDVFEAFYKRDLAKRLLMGRSSSTDAEKLMIGKLKAECGAAFTNKLEGMFKDVDLSRDALTAFRNSAVAKQRAPPGIAMEVNVLTSGYWPSYPIMDATLPAELAQGQEVFKDFYLSKHSGRRLVWQNALGQCIVRAQFPKGAHELAVSLAQTVVLSLFNEADSLTYNELKEASGIEEGELKRTLQSLALGKMRVLTKSPKGKEVDEADSFAFNEAFHAPLFRIKINSIQMKETAEENAKTNSQVMQDRQYQIDAAIVRIMKTRKQLSHKLLVGELMVQLKFPVRNTDLKKRIESLIDREYLARNRGDASLYDYLA